MKISRVTTMVMGTEWRNLTIVVVSTDEGVEGVGEVRMGAYTEALLGFLDYAIRTHVIGSDPFEIESLMRRLTRDDHERAGSVVMSGAAVIELACWDIIGKALNQPVYRLIGGAVRDRIKAYANGWYTVELRAEEFQAAAQRVVGLGYRALKLDPFGASRYELTHAELIRSVELVEAVRAAVGNEVEILIEMHGRFTPASAIAVSRALEPFEPSWIEEPVPADNPAALEKVSRNVNIPIATGERIHVRHEFRELFERQACDIVQADITQSGGLLEAKKLAAWAESYYLLMAPHNVGGPISTAASLHFAACTNNFKILEHFNDFGESWVKESAPGNPEVVDGHFALPAGPGLGVTLNADLVKSHPMRHIHGNLYADDWQFRRFDVTAKGTRS